RSTLFPYPTLFRSCRPARWRRPSGRRAGWIAGWKRSLHRVLQDQTVDLDAYHVAGLQGESLVRHDARAGEQECAAGEGQLAEQVAGQFLQTALDLRGAGIAAKHLAAAAQDRQGDRQVGHGLRLAQADGRADRAGTVVDLGLRQVQRVLALDAARGHVVADGVAADGPGAVQHQYQLRLGHVPATVAAHAHRLAVAAAAPAGGLEEQLRPLGTVYLLVHVGALRFGLAGHAAAQVGHAAGPGFLVVLDRSQQRAVGL